MYLFLFEVAQIVLLRPLVIHSDAGVIELYC